MTISVHYDERERDYFATVDETGESWVVPARNMAEAEAKVSREYPTATVTGS